MRAWKVVLLVDLALALGVGGGYLFWRQEVRRLQDELATAGLRIEPRAPADEAVQVRGIVRLVQPSQSIVWLTHETIPGVMEGMTMPFEAADESILDGFAPGDRVRFTLRRRDGQFVVVAMEKEVEP